MAGMAALIEPKSLKLLAQAGQVLNQMVSEGLCDEPQKKLMRAMLAELHGMLDEFEEAYFNGESTD
jgi:hypothetical protein